MTASATGAAADAARPRQTDPQFLGPENLDERDLLARVLWGEARGEGRVGMQAVANVVMTRARHPRWWGRDVRSCCLKPWQFSCLNASDPNLAKLLAVDGSDPDFRDAFDLAGQAIAGSLVDLTREATHYHSIAMARPPVWVRDCRFTVRIGHHAFYRDRAL